MFNIEKKDEGKKLELMLSGRLDTTTAPQLEEVVNKGLSGKDTLVFNMQDLEYISSAGLRTLLAAQKIMNKQGTMTVTNASDGIKEIFSVTGFSDILTIE
ncbi:MAG: STAS domain-containing protein [Lachnospiraceae bacterium]|nr:STAS domain-containing protein [Lachnospiraceae bacterium]